MNTSIWVIARFGLASDTSAWREQRPYRLLDGYPASLGFPVMHRAHATAYAPNLKGKGRFVNGWFVNIPPPLKFPSLPCSHAPSLSIPPPLTSSLPSFPRAVHASFGPLIPRSFPSSTLPLTLPPFLHWRSLPPSLHPSLPPSPTSLPPLPASLPPLPPSALTTRPPRAPPHPTQCRPTSCVCGVGELR